MFARALKFGETMEEIKIMKKISKGVLGVLALLLLSNASSFAIEGLQVSIPATNAVLSWPSDPSETYLVQYRNTLNATDSWATLTDYLPADSGTNITLFVDPNPVQYASSGSGTNGGGSIDPGGTNNASSGTNIFSSTAGFYRVVRDGAHLFGLANGATLSGTVRIPVELANGSGAVSAMSLTEDDSPAGNSIQTAPLNSPLALIVDTTQMSNGVHQISASARWDDTNGGLWEADSPPVSVTVSNEISFPNWMPSFGELGNSLLIRATSAHTNTNWHIDVYDSQDAYIGTFGGHTDDGDISVVWDLIGPDSVRHTNDNFFNFYVGTEYVDPPTPPIIKVNDPWSGPGAWAIAVQHDWDGTYNHDLLYQEFNSGFVAAAASLFTVLPSPDGDGNPLALHVGDPSDPQPDADWASFRQAITNSLTRNLVYFGHDGPDGIGKNTANAKRYISANEIANALHTNPAGQTNRHAFRFVFLDGCSTAKGALPEAFGIIHRVNVDLNDYAAASLRPSAFAGWTADKWITFLFGIYLNDGHVNFISHVQLEMFLYGKGI